MKKILIIMQREYLSRVRKKAFIVTTLLAPLGFFGFAIVSILLSGYSSGTKHVAIIDDSGIFAATAFPDAPDGSVVFKKEKNYKEAEANIKEAKENNIDAIVKIPANYDLENPKKININCLSDKNVSMNTRAYINKTFSDKIRQLRAARINIDHDQLDNLNQDIGLNYKKLSDDKAKSIDAMIGIGVGYINGVIIYILLLVYGTMIMKGVMEEKTNRIMEVLVSSVKPVQLMLGKIIGIAAVGLTQFVLWILLMGLSFLIIPLLGLSPEHMQTMSKNNMAGGDLDPDTIQQFVTGIQDFHFAPVILVLVLFFLGGFLLYGSLFAAVGAAGGDETDSQSLTFPIMLPIIVSFVILIHVVEQPESNIAFWASMVPLSSPMIMPALVPSNPPMWQILTSLVLLYGGFVLCAAFAAKIYRTGILMYGKKTTFKEMGRWLFIKN